MGTKRPRDVAVAFLLAALVAGCGGSLEPYETEGGTPTRLDGSEVKSQALDVSEAVRLHPQEPVTVEGYLFAPRDDEPRLCTALEKSGFCREPSLVLDTSWVDLDRADALEAGCCALGLWSPRPLVLSVRLQRGRRALVLG